MWLDAQIGPYGQNTAAMAENIKAGASNILTGQNPNYYCYTFLQMYPQFGGVNAVLTVDVVADTNTFTTVDALTIGSLIADTTLNIPDGTTITNITATSISATLSVITSSNSANIGSASGITAGMLITDSTGNIPAGTIITSINGTTITMSNNATTTATALAVTISIQTVAMSNNASSTANLSVTVYPMLVPAVLLTTYIALATTSIMERRWHGLWQTAIGWFVAHFLTLYLESYAAPGSNAAQVVAAAQSKGITASKSVGPVHVSYDLAAINADLDTWAAWKLTIYGQQLATFGNMVGKGGMVVL